MFLMTLKRKVYIYSVLYSTLKKQKRVFMQKSKLILNIIFSLSIIYLATSIILFSISLNNLNKELPGILNSIDDIEGKLDVESILKTVDKTVNAIPDILDETKNVREEVAEIRKLLPDILKRVDDTNSNIPIIVKEVEQTRKVIPDILNESDEIRKTIKKGLPLILKESKKIRKTIPPILSESQALRKEIPVEIDKIDKIIQDGVIGGTLKNIIRLPKKIVKGTNSSEEEE